MNRILEIKQQKLLSYLSQQSQANNWSQSIQALVDVISYKKIPVLEEHIHLAITCCSSAGKIEAVYWIYKDLHKHIKRPPSTKTHELFFETCGRLGSFRMANKELKEIFENKIFNIDTKADVPSLLSEKIVRSYLDSAINATLFPNAELDNGPQVSKSMFDKSSDNRSMVLTRIMTLQSLRNQKLTGEGLINSDALCSFTNRGTNVISSSNSIWEDALSQFIALRKNSLTRSCVSLSKGIIFRLVRLAEVSSQWNLCLKLLEVISRQNCLIPGVAYDSAIQGLYKGKQYASVVAMIRRCIVTCTPLNEKSVRNGIYATEEVAEIESTETRLRKMDVDHNGIHKNASDDEENFVKSSWALACRLFASLEENGFSLYQQTFESPLRTCCLNRQWSIALQFLEKMKSYNRYVFPHTYQMIILSRLECMTSVKEAIGFLHKSNCYKFQANEYLSLAKCSLRCLDWKAYRSIRKEMIHKGIPETFDWMRLVIESYFLQRNWINVIRSFLRFDRKVSFERQRVEKDRIVSLYEADFILSRKLYSMVLFACNSASDPDESVKRAKELLPKYCQDKDDLSEKLLIRASEEIPTNNQLGKAQFPDF